MTHNESMEKMLRPIRLAYFRNNCKYDDLALANAVYARGATLGFVTGTIYIRGTHGTAFEPMGKDYGHIFRWLSVNHRDVLIHTLDELESLNVSGTAYQGRIYMAARELAVRLSKK